MVQKSTVEDKLKRKADRIAVKAVSIVMLRMIGTGKATRFLGAYDGVEAAREIRDLIVKRFS